MYSYLFNENILLLVLRQGNLHKEELRADSFVQPFFIQLALGLLILGSIFSGYFLSDIFSSNNQFFYHLNMKIFNSDIIHSTFLENEFLP